MSPAENSRTENEAVLFSRANVYSTTDFTFYATNEEFEKVEREQRAKSSPSKSKRKPSYSFTVNLNDPKKPKEKYNRGRVLACRCFGGQAWSLTVRAEAAPKGQRYDYGIAEKSQYQASDSHDHGMFSIKDICTLLNGLIFTKTAPPRGIVIVTGSTNSAKSLIARGLIDQYLTRRLKELRSDHKGKKAWPRKPHLVTLEDPIETRFWKDKDGRGIKGPARNIDYTPRQTPHDADGLKGVLHDALRQTPAILFVGETRQKADWEDLMDFAGAGHLVFTTAHAGSLTEALGKVLTATRANTPARRGYIVDRIFAVVHLVSVTLEDGVTALAPSVWRHQGEGRHLLTADGLCAVLPNNPMDDNCLKNSSSLGRLWCSTKLLDGLKKRVQASSGKDPKNPKNAKARAKVLQRRCKELVSEARRLDLEGK